MIPYLLKQLNLKKERIPNIEAFFERSRLKPYVKIITENPEITHNLRKIYPNKIKDNWDCIVELYRYNIKLSRAVYPYLAILENIIKIRVSDYLRARYGDEFYYNEKLFLELLGIGEFDKKILDKYFNCKINKFIREEIIQTYKSHDTTISKKAITNKINKIKRAICILSDAFEYRFKNSKCTLDDFIETRPTLNYWITLLTISGLYLNTSGNFDTGRIFPNATGEDIKTLKVITQKLDDIRLLRNGISHYSMIICTDIAKNCDLLNIYEKIIELYHLLGCDDVNYVIGDICCCECGNFEFLYKKFAFLHDIFRNRHQK